MGAEEVELLLDFLGFTEADASRLRGCLEFLEPMLGDIVEDLYAHVKEVPALATILEGHVAQCQLKQSAYVKQLLDARIDAIYTASRAWVGEVHRQLGVEPRWYMAAYSHLEDLILARLAEHPDLQTPDALGAVSRSLRKLICFDSLVACEAYAHSLQAARDTRERVLRDLSRPALLDLGQGVFVVPLVGSLDEDAVEALQGALLQVYALGARVLIIDLARLPYLDDATGTLFRLAGDIACAEGFSVVIAGVSPALSRDIVTNRIETAGLPLVRRLAEAVQAALQKAPDSRESART